MQEKLFEILNLVSTSTDEEISQAYRKARDRYRNDMFLEGNQGNEAARKLTELETLYAGYLSEKEMTVRVVETSSEQNDEPEVYKKVQELVKSSKLNEAQEILDNIMSREGAWHYYQAMVYYKKDWFTDSKKHLETAIKLEPSNEKFKNALARLVKLMNGGSEGDTQAQKVEKSEEWWKTGENEHNPKGGFEDNNRQMGGCEDTMNCCTQLLCLNILCNCCGGGSC